MAQGTGTAGPLPAHRVRGGAALDLLARLRRATGQPIPLAWAADTPELPAAIEVYPAGTLVAHGRPAHGKRKPGSEARAAIDACVRARLERGDGPSPPQRSPLPSRMGPPG